MLTVFSRHVDSGRRADDASMGTRGTAARLSAHDVRVHFEGVKALDGVDFTLKRGEILGLIGPNGAGKTTLLNVLTGMQVPDTGRVHLGDQDVSGWGAPRRAREGIGRTFQGTRLFERLTVFENIEVSAIAAGGSRRKASKLAGELVGIFKLGDVAERLARSLPHGIARRLEVARALGIQPTFLLLDEPAAGLNEEEASELVVMLRGVRDDFQLGLMLIEHDMPVIMSLSDWIQVLDHGRTLAVGPPIEISRKPEVKEAYLGVQTEGQGIA